MVPNYRVRFYLPFGYGILNKEYNLTRFDHEKNTQESQVLGLKGFGLRVSGCRGLGFKGLGHQESQVLGLKVQGLGFKG